MDGWETTWFFLDGKFWGDFRGNLLFVWIRGIAWSKTHSLGLHTNGSLRRPWYDQSLAQRSDHVRSTEIHELHGILQWSGPDNMGHSVINVGSFVVRDESPTISHLNKTVKTLSDSYGQCGKSVLWKSLVPFFTMCDDFGGTVWKSCILMDLLVHLQRQRS